MSTPSIAKKTGRPAGRRLELLRRPLLWLVAITSLLVLAWAAFAYLAVDPLARWLVPRIAKQQLASQAEVRRVSLDPWRLALTVEGLTLARADGGALAGVDRLEVDFDASSLRHWAWHFREIRLNGPRLRVDVAPDGRLNWADLLTALAGPAETPDKPSTTVPRVLVDRLAIDAGQIDYTERKHSKPVHVALQPLGLVLESLSTLPEDSGQYLLQARLPEQGGTLRWKGELALNPPASTGEVEASGFKLDRLAQLVPGTALPLEAIAGEAAARFGYRFAMVQGAAGPYAQLRVENLAVDLAGPGADLRLPGLPATRLSASKLRLAAPAIDLALLDSPRLQAPDLSVSLEQIALAAGHRQPATLQAGTLALGLDVTMGDKGWQMPRLEAELRNLVLTAAAPAPRVGQAPAARIPPLAQLASLRLEGGSADGARRQARVEALRLSGLRTQVLRPGAGQPLNWEALLQALASEALPSVPPSAASPLPSAGSAPAGSQKSGKPGLAGAPPSVTSPRPPSGLPSGPTWQARLGRLALADTEIRVEDRSTPQAVAMDLRSPLIELKDLSTDLGRALPVQGRVDVAQGGRLDLSGRLTPSPLRADLQLQLRELSVRPFGPYLSQVARLRLDSGFVNLRGRLALEMAGTEPRGSFRGSAGLRQLSLAEEDSGTSFLAWQDLTSDSVQAQLAPQRLRLQELRVVRPVGRFIIHEDGSLNVSRLLRSGAAASTAPAASSPSSSSRPTASTAPRPVQAQAPQPRASQPAPAASAPGLAVAIDRVSVDNASLEFADLTLRPQFGTHIDALSGVINGLSNEPTSVAQVELDGRVEDFGSARIRGTVQPWRASEFTDLRLAFRNLEMTHLTPYSGKFAGRRIDSGRLSVDLEYKIKNRQLAGENKFVVNQLKLGARVDSPDALRLPLDLAIAVLQDSDGVIDLDLPITGSLDDPQFSYGRLIWKAITNVLTRVVTAPFRALGNLLGRDADKAGEIQFDPGSAALAPPEQEKLQKIAQALAKRPALRLGIVPTYDTVADTWALQEQAMRRAVLAEAGITLRTGEQPGPLDLMNSKVQSAVARQLAAGTGKSSRFALASRLVDNVKDAVRTPKPEDLPRLQQMVDQLRPTYPVSATELAGLANARAAAMREFLVREARLPEARLQPDAAASANNSASKGKPASVIVRLNLASS